MTAQKGDAILTSLSTPETPFSIHLSRTEVVKRDEYAQADPYSVEENLTRPFHRRRIDLTLELLRSTDEITRILDVGCGEGYITAEIKREFPSAEVHGFDCSLSAIGKAHPSFPAISFSVADALKSDYPPGPF